MQYLNPGQLLGQNLFINGACQVAQRPTKALSGVYDYGGTDRFCWAAGGTVTAGTIQQGTGLSFGATGTSTQVAGLSISAGTYITAEQCIEAKVAALLKNQNFSTSILINHDAGVTVYAAIAIYALTAADNFDGGYNLVYQGPRTAIPSGTPTMLFANNITGADTSNGVIYDVQFYGDAAGAGLPALTNKNFHVTNWQLNLGPKVAKFVPGRFDDELRACLRYYETGRFFHVGYVNGAMNFGSEVVFKTTKVRTPPIVSQANVSTVNCSATPQQADQWVGGFLSFRTGTAAGAAQYNETWAADADF